MTITLRQKQQIIGDWLLPPAARAQVELSFQNWQGNYLKQKVDNGTISLGTDIYQITWLDLPETCYRAPFVNLSFRRSINNSKMGNYCLIALPINSRSSVRLINH